MELEKTLNGAAITVSLKGTRIMLIDDEPAFLDATSALLVENTEAVVKSFTNPAQALESLESANPACVITDMVMPGYNGLELIRMLVKKRPGLPCILVTGNSIDPRTLERGRVPELREVMFKPVTWMQLASSVAKALATKPDEPLSFYAPVGRW